MNWVDMVSVVPYYIQIIVDATSAKHAPTLQVFRILRLVRVFRLFRMSRAVTEIFAKTMQLSAKPLYMLVFFTCLGVVFFSSLLYYAERGVYDGELGVWKRVAYYQCPVWLKRDAPNKFSSSDVVRCCLWALCLHSTAPLFLSRPLVYAYVRTKLPVLDVITYLQIPSGLDDMDCEFQQLGATPQRALFICPYRFPKNSQCREVFEISPFESIPATFWWW